MPSQVRECGGCDEPIIYNEEWGKWIHANTSERMCKGRYRFAAPKGQAMSARSSILCHLDEETGIKVHVYIDLARQEYWIEIVTPYVVMNVPWPFGEIFES